MEPLTLGATEALSDFVSDTKADAIPEEAVARAKASVLDWIGSAYSGKGSLTDGILYHRVKESGGRRIATLVGCKRSAPPEEAALYNGAVSSVMEIDDVHEEAGIHAGIGVIPASLAVAEYTHSPGKDLIAAIVLGYDITVRLARAAGVSHYDFWHSTGTCNAFGAAAAAGKLLGLDPPKLTMALGLAGTQASGLWESLNREGTMAKHLHSGKASSNGVFSALLARDGFKGSKAIIEGEKGFLASSSRATDQDRIGLTKDLGRPFLIMRNFFKRYACCRTCFEGMEGIHGIFLDQHLSSEEIETITATLIPRRIWLVGNPDPKDLFEAKFSLPFAMALIGIRRDAGLYEFTSQSLNDPVIRDLMGKIRLVSDLDLVPKTRVEVTCKDGAYFVAEPSSRSLRPEEVKEKFIRTMSLLLKPEHLSGILSAVDNLDRMEDAAELTRLLKEKPVRRIE